jgi:hypothetical protein
MKASLLLVCLMFANSVRSFPQSQPQKLKIPGPEVQNLMLGKWSTQVKYAPRPEMPKGGTGEGTEVWLPGPGGFSVIEESREKNAKGDYEGLGVAWWDSKAQGQRFVWCDSSNPDGCYVSKVVAKWDGASLRWKEEQENAGKKRVYSEVFRDITPTAFTQVLGEGEPGEATKTTVTIQATKVSETPMNGIAASAARVHVGGDWESQETTNNINHDKNSEATVASNVLASPLKSGRVELGDLAKVQSDREWPTRIIQAAQSAIQKRVIANVLSSQSGVRIPPLLSLAVRIPVIRDIPARLIAFGVHRAHVEN